MDDAVRIVTTPATPLAVVAEATTWDAFPQLWGSLLAEVWAFLRSSELTTGRNVMLYKDDAPTVEVGAEVSGPFAGNGRVVPSTLPAGRAARTVARGGPTPHGLAKAHNAVLEWCNANGHALTRVRWEIYGHWLEDQDPAQFETEIYWLLQPEPVKPRPAVHR
jgi:effector-binding domain-containing protein